MLFIFILLFPLLLESADPDRLTDLVEEMRQLTLAGDHRAVGGLAPVLLEELAKPHSNAAIAWNQVAVHFHTQGDYIKAERAYQQGIRLVEKDANPDGGLEPLLLLNLASLYLETGQRPAVAEVLSRRALTQAIEHYGAASPELANFIYTLGAARQEQGDRNEARRYFQQALDLAPAHLEGKLRQGTILANIGVLGCTTEKW